MRKQPSAPLGDGACHGAAGSSMEARMSSGLASEARNEIHRAVPASGTSAFRFFKARGTRQLMQLAPCLLLSWNSALAAEQASFKDRFEFEVNANASTANTFYGDFALTYSASAPFYETGLKFRLSGSDTRYQYDAGPSVGHGNDRTLDFLVGGGLLLGGWYVTALLGPSVTWSWQSPTDITTTQGALKSVLSLYGKPTQETMLFLQATYLTMLDAYCLQAKFGHELAPNIYLGPEAILTGRMHIPNVSAQYDELRVGMFVSGLQAGPVSLGISGGFLHDRDQRNGAYVSTNARVSF